MSRHKIKLDITPEEWAATGDFNDCPAHTRLFAPIIEIAGTYHHLMAIEVEDRDDVSYATNPALQPELEAIFLLNGDAPSTTEINGRTYMLCLFPHAV